MNKVSVLIIGAGSIGNHMAFGCRQKEWDVSIYDIEIDALERTKKDIYPSRYGKWDDEIELLSQIHSEKSFDLVIIGTPPDKHINIAISTLIDLKPKVILIEKPLCPPDMHGLAELQSLLAQSHTLILVGYNHNLTSNTIFVENLINDGILGEPLSMHVRWLEHWGGIFDAHPWLSGPEDSYLGFWERGGGACGEHSHAISIWEHFSKIMGCGKIIEASTIMNMFEQKGLCYDESTFINVKSETGLIGSIIQDVVTEPTQKTLRIQGLNGFIEWHVNFNSRNDAVVYGVTGKKTEMKLFPKTRPDDFIGELNHIEQLMINRSKESPISLECGIECMKVIAAAFKSNINGIKVNID